MLIRVEFRPIARSLVAVVLIFVFVSIAVGSSVDILGRADHAPEVIDQIRGGHAIILFDGGLVRIGVGTVLVRFEVGGGGFVGIIIISLVFPVGIHIDAVHVAVLVVIAPLLVGRGLIEVLVVEQLGGVIHGLAAHFGQVDDVLGLHILGEAQRREGVVLHHFVALEGVAPGFPVHGQLVAGAPEMLLLRVEGQLALVDVVLTGTVGVMVSVSLVELLILWGLVVLCVGGPVVLFFLLVLKMGLVLSLLRLNVLMRLHWHMGLLLLIVLLLMLSLCLLHLLLLLVLHLLLLLMLHLLIN